MRSFILFTLLTLSTSISGCTSHYIIASKLEMAQRQELPDIVETDTYRNRASKVRTVALKAPSKCSNKTSDQRTGKANSQELMLGTNCAVDMAEIERALTKASYRVISWTILEREMESNAQQQLSPLMAAKKLGAEILFQINSLDQSERSIANLSKDVEWKFAYYESDDYGERLGEKEFDAETREYLRKKFFRNDELIKQVRIPSVTLDANASLVETAESIWFYRWTDSDLSLAYAKDQLISCKPPMVCRLDSPRGNNNETNSSKNNSNKASKENQTYSTDDQPENIDKAIRFKLVKQVANNMVSSFAKN